MLSIRARCVRGLLRNFHPSLERCLSSTTARTRQNQFDGKTESNIYQTTRGGKAVKRTTVGFEKGRGRGHTPEGTTLRRGHLSRVRSDSGASLNDFKHVKYDEKRDNPKFESSREESREQRCKPSRYDSGVPSIGSLQGSSRRDIWRSSSPLLTRERFPSKIHRGDSQDQRRRPSRYDDEVSIRALRDDRRFRSAMHRKESQGQRRKPSRYDDEISDGGLRDNGRFQSSRPQDKSTSKMLPKELIPRLSSEHQEKINTAQKIFEARSIYFTPPLVTGVPDGGAISVSPARSTAHAKSAAFFTSAEAKFLYSAQNFRQHPLNTTTPEVCVIGASNCGKSSFVNALAGLTGKDMAKVGRVAGKTVMMNAFGVGPLRGLPPRKIRSPPASGEKPSCHGMILVDTPGYGFASRKEWGREIMEYMRKRTMLKGIVLLLSAEKRVSAQDEAVMKLVADSGRPAMVVFTKLDKTLRLMQLGEPGFEWRLREVESVFARTGWDGWHPEIHMTAANMDKPKGHEAINSNRLTGMAGMAGVRMEMLDMIGLRPFVAPYEDEPNGLGNIKQGEETTVDNRDVTGGEKELKSEEKRQKPGKALESDPTAWDGEIISYEELEKKFGDWSS